MTPHIECQKNDIAPLVIMPGDPKRARYIAEKYLENAKLVNSVREEYGYTGFYKNIRITVFSSGMGNASMGIYSHELFKFYDVKAILRVGSCGGYCKNININDLFILSNVFSNSNYALEYANLNEKLMSSSKILNDTIMKTAEELKINLESITGNNVDAFYNTINESEVNKYNCKIVEMESFALFTNAKVLNKLCSTLVTVSDNLVTGKKLTSLEREKSFDKMIILALESIIKI